MENSCPYAFEDISRGGGKLLYCKAVHGCIPAAGDFEVSNDLCPYRDSSRCPVYKMLDSGQFSDEFVRYLNDQDGFYLVRLVAIPKNLGKERKQAIEANAKAHGLRLGKCLPNEFADFYLGRH